MTEPRRPRNAIHEHVDLWIDEGKIESLQPHNPKRPVGASVQRIDCSSFTVTPGLIDCHGHVTLFGIGRDPLERMNSLEGLLYAERILYTTLVNGGVTTLRDVGGATHLLKRLVQGRLPHRSTAEDCDLYAIDHRRPCRFSRPRSMLWGGLSPVAARTRASLKHC